MKPTSTLITPTTALNNRLKLFWFRESVEVGPGIQIYFKLRLSKHDRTDGRSQISARRKKTRSSRYSSPNADSRHNANYKSLSAR